MSPVWILFLVSLAYAGDAAVSAKAKRSGASSMMDPMDFASCVKESVHGSKDGKCSNSEDLPSCLGLKKSLENFREKQTCMNMRGAECIEWGYKGRTQAQWMAIAAGHLSKFGTCIRKRYGSDEDSGNKAASHDKQLIAALRKMQDGGSALGFLEGDFLVQSLSGDRFSVILQNSAIASDYKPHDFYRLKDAADNPAKVEFIRISEEENQNRRSNYASSDDPFYDFIEENETASPTTIVADSEKLPQQTEAKVQIVRNLSSELEIPLKPKVKNNPFTLGLDRSLFERVSSAYQKRAGDFRSIDEYVKESKANPAKDFRDLLKRGETL